MTGMRTIRYNSDSTTTYECPLCLKHETVYSNGQLQHTPENSTCLQRQITALQETVQSCVEELRGLGVEF